MSSEKNSQHTHILMREHLGMCKDGFVKKIRNMEETQISENDVKKQIGKMKLVTHPLYESRMHWIPYPTPPPPCRTGMDYSDTPVQTRDAPVKSRSAHAKSCASPVLTSDTQASAIATSA